MRRKKRRARTDHKKELERDLAESTNCLSARDNELQEENNNELKVE